ncbi:MAG: hypothetical protein D3922_02060, partial [Candidatus Electrothrix sp. AR1]|nr:hypothetical protein [Candidatus Electrothrix sp. AR1]
MDAYQEDIDKKTNSNDKNDDFTPLGGLLIGIILLFFIYFGFTTTIPFDERGTFGDMFGGLNALFSGFAFVGIIYTIFLQKKELALQRREIEYSREEMQRNNFKDIFFKLLAYKKEVIGSMEIVIRTRKGKNPPVEQVHNGISFFEHKLEWLTEVYFVQERGKNQFPTLSPYERFYAHFGFYFDQYFIYLYQIVNFLDQERLTQRDKKLYLELLKSQLTAVELSFLFFHHASPLGTKEFKLLIEQYCFFERFPSNLAGKHKMMLQEYAVSAFGHNSLLLDLRNSSRGLVLSSANMPKRPLPSVSLGVPDNPYCSEGDQKGFHAWPRKI